MTFSNAATRTVTIALSALTLGVGLSACQRVEPLPAEKTAALIEPVARIEVSTAPPAPAAPAAPAAAAPAPAPAPDSAAAAPAPATTPATPAAAPAAAPKATAGGRMVLGEVVFEGGAAALPAEAAATVDAVANYVTANAGVRVEILAHADKAGPDLAKERAQAVRTALAASGVKEDQIAVSSTAATDAKAAQRVELLLASGPSSAAPAPAASAPAAAGGAKADGKGVYDKTCVACHSAGVAGAPKVGDKAAWAPRLAGGVGALVQSALKGKGAMPPKGGNTALSEAEIKAAVEHMVSLSK